MLSHHSSVERQGNQKKHLEDEIHSLYRASGKEQQQDRRKSAQKTHIEELIKKQKKTKQNKKTSTYPTLKVWTQETDQEEVTPMRAKAV